MSIRARSAVGAVLMAAGMLGMVGTALFNRAVLFWVSAGAVAAGIAVIALAIRTVAREIGGARVKYDALLRAQLPPEKRDPPPPQ